MAGEANAVDDGGPGGILVNCNAVPSLQRPGATRFDGDTPSRFVEHSSRKLLANGCVMFFVDASDQHLIFGFHQFCGNGGYLGGCLAGAEYDLRETFSQRPMRVDFGKIQIFEWHCLETALHLLLGNLSGLELAKKIGRFVLGHTGRLSATDEMVTRFIHQARMRACSRQTRIGLPGSPLTGCTC